MAITATEDMDHAPLESLVFNSYKALKKNAKCASKKLLEKMGEAAYRKLVIKIRKDPTCLEPDSDLTLLTAQAL